MLQITVGYKVTIEKLLYGEKKYGFSKIGEFRRYWIFFSEEKKP
ncbi:hypothetical protein MIDIC_530005 [Alphaproteobacteria bacterium]